MWLHRLKCFLFSFVLLLLTGCIYGDLDKMAINEAEEMSLHYCQSQQLNNCEAYQRCFKEQLFLFNKGFAGTVSSVIGFNSPVENYQRNYEETMDNIYNNIIEREQESDISVHKMLFERYSLVLYIHNNCADISGDKKYNIDRYIPLVEQKLKTSNK